MPDDTCSACANCCRRLQLFSMYGMTECKRISYLPPEQLDLRPTSVGRGMPNQECWLVDEAGQRAQRLDRRARGARQPCDARLLGEAGRTAQRLKPGPCRANASSTPVTPSAPTPRAGSISSRAATTSSDARRRWPLREVENAIQALSGVLECAVVGVPDERLGQAVKAFVKVKPGAVLAERDVIRHCLARLESYMAPSRWCSWNTCRARIPGKSARPGCSDAARPITRRRSRGLTMPETKATLRQYIATTSSWAAGPRTSPTATRSWNSTFSIRPAFSSWCRISRRPTASR